MSFAAIFTSLKSVPKSTWGWIAALVAVLILMSTCTVIGIQKDADEERIVKEMNEDRAARDKASDARLEDAKRIDNNTEMLNEAVQSLPDGVPSDRRLALACQRLRNDEHRELPAACGPTANRQAPAGPAADHQRGIP